MRPTLLCCCAALAGCVATPKPSPPVPTDLRVHYSAGVWPALAKALEAEGFEPELIRADQTRHGGSNAEENTEQDEVTVLFRVTRNGLRPPLTTAEAGAVLARLKADFRRAVNGEDESEVLSTAEDEAFQERTIKVTYLVGKVHGTAAFKWTPYTDDGDLVNRLEVVFREQPPPK